MKKSTITTKIILASVCVLMFSISACKTVPKDISMDLTEAELLQLAQDSVDDNNNKAARVYYERIIMMYGSNYASLVVAEYELAHLDIKEKNYKDAKPALERIISYYDNPEIAPLLNPSYKKLAIVDLKKCN